MSKQKKSCSACAAASKIDLIFELNAKVSSLAHWGGCFGRCASFVSTGAIAVTGSQSKSDPREDCSIPPDSRSFRLAKFGVDCFLIMIHWFDFACCKCGWIIVLKTTVPRFPNEWASVNQARSQPVSHYPHYPANSCSSTQMWRTLLHRTFIDPPLKLQRR